MKSNKNPNFNISDSTFVKYTGSEQEVIIPDGITAISPYAFENCKTLQNIETSVELSSIGKGAFYGCDNLKQMTLPGWLYNAIDLKDIFDNPSGIYFRFYASTDGNNSSQTTPQPAQQTEVVNATQATVSNAQEVETQPRNTVLIVSQNVEEEQKEQEEQTPQVQVEKSDVSNLFVSSELEPYDTLAQRIEAVTPPAESGNITVTRKSNYKEEKDFLIENTLLVKYLGTDEDVKIPDYIKEIGEHAFSNSSVVNVEIPEGVIKIGVGAFAWCDRIKHIKFPLTMRVIDDEAFADCSGLEEIIIPVSVKYIGANAFHACSSAKILRISSSATIICRRAFDFCVGIDEVKIPVGTTELAEGLFSHCEGLTRVILPDGLQKIGNWAFAECGQLKEINYPQSLKSIGEVAFMNCKSLKELNLPAGITSLGRQAYVGCTGLSAVFIPKKLEGQVKSLKVFNGLKKVQIGFVEFM